MHPYLLRYPCTTAASTVQSERETNLIRSREHVHTLVKAVIGGKRLALVGDARPPMLLNAHGYLTSSYPFLVALLLPLPHLEFNNTCVKISMWNMLHTIKFRGKLSNHAVTIIHEAPQPSLPAVGIQAISPSALPTHLQMGT